MPAACRVGDIGVGVCPHHSSSLAYTTTIITGASKCATPDGKAIAIVGSIGVSTCGHNTIAQTGSSKGRMDGQPIHRLGDTGANFGPYTMTVASSKLQVP